MPKATVNNDTVRENLTTLEGAYVELRRLSFGKKQERQDLVLKMTMNVDQKKKETKGEISSSAMVAALFDFKHCVIQHNLFKDDEETIALDLSNPRDLAELDPRVGEEISTLIDKLNNFEQSELDDLGNGSSV